MEKGPAGWQHQPLPTATRMGSAGRGNNSADILDVPLCQGCGLVFFRKLVKKVLDDPNLANETVKPFAHHVVRMVGQG